MLNDLIIYSAAFAFYLFRKIFISKFYRNPSLRLPTHTRDIQPATRDIQPATRDH